MSNMKIGEIIAFKCVEVRNNDNPCEGCAFNDKQYPEGSYSEYDRTFGNCESFLRKDGKDVIFVRIDSNEIIRERIEKSIDRLSGGDDDKMIAFQSTAGECRIGFKASYWKRMLGEILKLEEEKEESKC